MSKPYTIRWTKSGGPGGQKKNKTANCCIITHTATGTTATGDCRTRKESQRVAMEELANKLCKLYEDEEARKKKARRDEKVKGGVERIRTYDYTRGVVTDHRSGKAASLKDILEKGKLDKLK